MIVVKSISKSYGVPGLRLGVMASSNMELVSWMKKDVPIWNINSFAEFFMQIYNKYDKDYVTACHRFQEERCWFYDRLKTIPFLNVVPSQANYFLCEVLPPLTSHRLAVELLEKENILIKNCSAKKGFNGSNYIRLAIRNREDNTKLVDALKRMKI